MCFFFKNVRHKDVTQNTVALETIPRNYNEFNTKRKVAHVAHFFSQVFLCYEEKKKKKK